MPRSKRPACCGPRSPKPQAQEAQTKSTEQPSGLPKVRAMSSPDHAIVVNNYAEFRDDLGAFAAGESTS